MLRVRAALMLNSPWRADIFCDIPKTMGKSIRDIPKSRHRGRPKTTGRGEGIMLRLPPPLLTDLDAWAERQRDAPSRPEAIRRLVEQALGASSPRRRSKESKHKAAEMAGQEIDRLGDQGLTREQQAARKRRLIKGPREFRDVRGDQSKTKS